MHLQDPSDPIIQNLQHPHTILVHTHVGGVLLLHLIETPRGTKPEGELRNLHFLTNIPSETNKRMAKTKQQFRNSNLMKMNRMDVMAKGQGAAI